MSGVARIIQEITVVISPIEYPVYNHRERPGIGKDLAGNLFFNCFSVKLARDDESSFRPFLFSDFIRQYNDYAKYSGVCETCIAKHRIITYPVDGLDVDRSAVERKFSHGDVDTEAYYYCPLIDKALSASKLSAEVANVREQLPANPISAILSGNWDDEYLVELTSIGYPRQVTICTLLQSVLSPDFISTAAEKGFFTLWFLSMFQQMENVKRAGTKVYWEDKDFDWSSSKIFRFIFPIPQVWLYIIPKPPHGVDWKQWEEKNRQNSIPQRVDFMFTYRGKRHVVEIDDVNHYGERSRGTWLASEKKYRLTLTDTRWLKVNGYEVIRFTNEEILELYDPKSGNKPNVEGFGELLRTVFLEPGHMVFL